MKTYKPYTRTELAIDKVLCNKCGSSLHCQIGNIEGLCASGIGGYHSIIGDCIRWEFDLCEKCLLDLWKTFQVHPISNPNPDFDVL